MICYTVAYRLEFLYLGSETACVYTYLFFLAEDPDPKQDHCFPVNSIQGWIKVENDKLTVSDENGVARGYTDLSQLVADINKVK